MQSIRLVLVLCILMAVQPATRRLNGQSGNPHLVPEHNRRANSSNIELPAPPRAKEFSVADVYQKLSSQNHFNQVDTPWWHQHVVEKQRAEANAYDISIDSMLFMAVRSSKQLQVAAIEPIIREQVIQEEDSRFDWVRYVDTAWNDTSDPVGNTLTVGNNNNFLNEHSIQGNIGTRRVTRAGAQLDIGQQLGFQNSNSNFLIPNNQATSRLTISYTHPLRRGNGYEYNNSLVMLATAESEIAYDDFTAQLQDHLLEIVRAYWRLYLERADLAQRVRLYLKTKQLVSILETRQRIDTKGTQLVTASAALENRRADLIRAMTAVKNAETRLRAMINAADLGIADLIELIPVEVPTTTLIDADLQSEFETAITNRPEAIAALRRVKAGTIRMNIAEHEILPLLNLVTEAYVNGLRGNGNIGGSVADQFTKGAPGYSVGFQYEVPWGNRRAYANMTKRQLELRRLKLEYEQALETIRTEVDIAVREMKTTFQEIHAKQRALAAANTEAETIEVRWRRMIDGNGQAGLNLESLLRAQERVTEAERELANTLLLYNLSLVNLKKATGTFLQHEQITVDRIDDPSEGPRYVLGKGVQQAIYVEEMQVQPVNQEYETFDSLKPSKTPSFAPLQIPFGEIESTTPHRSPGSRVQFLDDDAAINLNQVQSDWASQSVLETTPQTSGRRKSNGSFQSVIQPHQLPAAPNIQSYDNPAPPGASEIELEPQKIKPIQPDLPQHEDIWPLDSKTSSFDPNLSTSFRFGKSRKQ